MFELAHELGQPLSTIMAMTQDEFSHWFTFLRLKAKRQKDGNRTGAIRHSRKR